MRLSAIAYITFLLAGLADAYGADNCVTVEGGLSGGGAYRYKYLVTLQAGCGYSDTVRSCRANFYSQISSARTFIYDVPVSRTDQMAAVAVARDFPACLPCQSGKTSGARSTSCGWCPAGKTGAGAGGGCSTCPAGKYGQGQAKGCHNCAAGHIADANSGSCTPCHANASPNGDKSGCVCNDGYAGNGFICTDKCTMDLADEHAGTFASVKNAAKALGKGQKIDMAAFGLGAMDRCSPEQVAKKRRQGFQQIIAGLTETAPTASQLSGAANAIGLDISKKARDQAAKAAKFGHKFREEAVNFDVDLSEAGMPEKFLGKAAKMGAAQLKILVVRAKQATQSDTPEDQCFESDIDLSKKGLYDVVMNNVDDQALACRGKKPVAKLQKTSTGYKYKCWRKITISGGNTISAWAGTWTDVDEGDEFTCDQQEFFVQSLAAVATSAYYSADGDTIFKVVGPDSSIWKNEAGSRGGFVAATEAEAANAEPLAASYSTSDGNWAATDNGYTFEAGADGKTYTFSDACECDE